MSQSNTSESPPAKRRRMDGAEELTRSDIWHDDGSVVLQVESTLFRVHWSVISLHSPFFRGMRDLPQPAEQPSIEGCPVVVLHDSSEDVQYFLHALYNPHLFNEEKLSFPFIAAIVRVGRKYDFKNLLAAAVQRLRLENPTTFDKYEAMTRVEGSTISFTTQLMSSQPGIILDILTLVRESNLFELLPSAYLRALLCHSQEMILDGVLSSNGRLVKLSFQDQRICILGRQKMSEAQWSHGTFFDWITSDTHLPGCTGGLGCTATKRIIFYNVLQKAKALAPFTLISVTQLCPVCLSHHQEVMAEVREDIWEELPSFFGLPPWGELKNDI
ncbi:hypothetical protein DFH08DRAFT_713983 [Mycena albidolilacea]|uniref:BTB domain-containing protein n=1 Tax=Mycena albidolilacea TaxID=1033008 RepID=A0AAD6ZE85_9AGAR|nr:hypothetical protein DFH08DRAFT_713983 [Mycena albidolilacea]